MADPFPEDTLICCQFPEEHSQLPLFRSHCQLLTASWAGGPEQGSPRSWDNGAVLSLQRDSVTPRGSMGIGHQEKAQYCKCRFC